MNIISFGFTGTRYGMTNEQKTNVKNLLLNEIEKKNNIIIHHGDCIGADYDLHNICLDILQLFNESIQIIIHPPNDKKLRAFCQSNNIQPEKNYLERNKNIVNNCNILIACPFSKNEIKRSGTWMTIRYAKKKNKEIFIF